MEKFNWIPWTAQSSIKINSPKVFFRIFENLSSCHNSLSFHVAKLRLKVFVKIMSYSQERSYKKNLYKRYSKREGFIDEQVNNLLLVEKHILAV